MTNTKCSKVDLDTNATCQAAPHGLHVLCRADGKRYVGVRADLVTEALETETSDPLTGCFAGTL